MAKKQETVLTEVAGKIGTALGVIAAEAAKAVRPLRRKRVKRLQAHSSNVKRRGTASARRNRNMRKRTKRNL